MDLMYLSNLAWEELMEFIFMFTNIAYNSNLGLFLVSFGVSIIFLINLKAGSVLINDLVYEALGNRPLRKLYPSPVNIERRLVHKVSNPDHLEWFNYDNMPSAVLLQNNGTTLVVHLTSIPDCQPFIFGNSLFGNYFFVEAIFKWGGSEHLIDSRRYAMEMQVLHATNQHDAPFEYLTISYLFMETRRKNIGIDRITEGIPAIVTAGAIVEVPPFDLVNLFWRFHTGYYSYFGTYANGTTILPTQWFVCNSIFHISTEQLDRFETLRRFDGHTIVENSRPVRLLGDRTVQLNDYF